MRTYHIFELSIVIQEFSNARFPFVVEKSKIFRKNYSKKQGNLQIPANDKTIKAPGFDVTF